MDQKLHGDLEMTMQGNGDREQERRRFPRIRATIYYFIDEPLVDDPYLRGGGGEGSVEIGAGGVRIYSDEDIPEGKVLNLTIFLPTRERVVVRGEVVWKRRLPPGRGAVHEVGLKFIDLKGDDVERIKRFVEEQE